VIRSPGVLGIELQHIIVAWCIAVIALPAAILWGRPSVRALSAVALTILLLAGAAIALPWFVSDH
jgi:hypothetical protein